eukprot:4366107-Alexandrium_andersonii.AAC.1
MVLAQIQPLLKAFVRRMEHGGTLGRTARKTHVALDELKPTALRVQQGTHATRSVPHNTTQ